MTQQLFISPWTAGQQVTDYGPSIIQLYFKGYYGEAFRLCCKAINENPGNALYKAYLGDFTLFTVFNKFDPAAKQAFIHCFEEDSLPHQVYMSSWFTLFEHDPDFEIFRDIFAYESYEEFTDKLDIDALAPCLQAPFLMLAVKRSIVASLAFEKALTYIRRFFLDAIAGEKENIAVTEQLLPFLASLSEYCWHSEYIFETTADEKEKVARLSAKLEKTAEYETPAAISELLVFSCYAPLYKLANAAQIADKASGLIASLVEHQIREPLEEKRIQGDIPSIGNIGREVSKKVREQYEENPYPRWKNTQKYAAETNPAEMDILSAGCGTGKEIATIHSRFPNARIVGTDLSLASLSYADRELKREGLEGKYELFQADILNLEQLERRFDYIYCNGVLHHMEDPVEGWKTLKTILKPGGLMRLSLYSKSARESIWAAREYITKQGYKPTVAGMKAFRKDAPHKADIPTAIYTQWTDFYNLSECRDLLFHVQEHVFTIPQIKAILAELDLEFQGFVLNGPRQSTYLQSFPEDTQMLNLDNWHTIEQQNPLIFTDMYQFEVQAKP